MKRKSPKCKEPSLGKAKILNDKFELIKTEKEYNDNQTSSSINKASSLDSTPENTRLKRLSLSSNKSKTSDNIKLASSLSNFPIQDIDNDISDDQYNELLKEISQNCNFDQAKRQPKKTTTIKDYHQNKYEKFNTFPFDYSLHKEISIEIIIDVASSSKKFSDDDYYKEIVNDIKNDLLKKERLGYYDYSNIHNISLNHYSQVDYVSYEHLYQRCQFLSQKVKEDIKDVNIVSTLSSVYKHFLKEKGNFYFITPMHTFLFSNLQKEKEKNNKRSNAAVYDEVDYEISLTPSILSQKGAIVVLSNTLLINKALDSNHISYTKIVPIHPKKIIEEEDEDLDVEEAISNLDKDKFNNNPAIIKGFHLTLFYNMLLNDYDKKTFNIVSSFSFEGATYRENKVKMEAYYKKGKNAYVICINVYGCIFESELRNIINLLSRKNKNSKLSKLAYTYSMRLERMTHNGEFYALNQKLNHSIEKVEYKDDGYYIK